MKAASPFLSLCVGLCCLLGCGARTGLDAIDASSRGDTSDGNDTSPPHIDADRDVSLDANVSVDSDIDVEPELRTWLLRMRRTRDETALYVTATTANTFVAVGSSATSTTYYSQWVVGISLDGQALWQHLFTHDILRLNHVAACANGDVIVGGSLREFGRHHSLWIVRLTHDGTVRWERIVRSGHALHLDSIVVATNGDILVTGTSSLDDTLGTVLIRLDPDGWPIWHTSFGEGTDLTPGRMSLSEGTDGRFFLLATEDPNDVFDANMWVAAIDDQGTIGWQKRIGGAGVEWAGGIAAGDGSVFVTGKMPEQETLLVTLTEEGEILWQRGIWSGHRYATSAPFSSLEGTFFVIDRVDRSSGSGTNYDGWLAEMGAGGEILWQRFFGMEQDENVSSIGLAGDGLLISGGFSTVPNLMPPEDDDAFVARLTRLGTFDGDCRWMSTANVEIRETDVPVQDTDFSPQDFDIEVVEQTIERTIPDMSFELECESD